MKTKISEINFNGQELDLNALNEINGAGIFGDMGRAVGGAWVDAMWSVRDFISDNTHGWAY